MPNTKTLKTTHKNICESIRYMSLQFNKQRFRFAERCSRSVQFAWKGAWGRKACQNARRVGNKLRWRLPFAREPRIYDRRREIFESWKNSSEHPAGPN